MNSLNSTISNHQKGQHLAMQDRVIIQVLRKQGQPLCQIAASLNCSPSTVKYELERGQITLYHYVECGLLRVKTTNLPKCLSRKTKSKRVCKHKRKLGRSISERPAAINQCREFGHWECNLVLGHKTTDGNVLLTQYERMTRKFMIIIIKGKTAASVMAAFKTLRSQYRNTGTLRALPPIMVLNLLI